MFFLHKRYYKQRQTTFSTAYQNDRDTTCVFSKKHPLMCKNKTHARRTVFASPILFQGSMTVEATVLLPFFLYLLLNLYSVMDMLCLQAMATWHLQQIGNQICIYGYLPELVWKGEEQSDLADTLLEMGFSYLYVRDRVMDAVDFPDKVFVTTASVLEEEKVELVLTYNYPLWMRLGKTKEVWLQSKYYGYAWGTDEDREKQTKAYVTVSGEVYHLYRDCSHLKLSVMQLPKECVKYASVIYGKEFALCRLCCNEEKDVVYITLEQGKIHFASECGGLKRGIEEKDLKWAEENYQLCQRCAERKEKENG